MLTKIATAIKYANYAYIKSKKTYEYTYQCVVKEITDKYDLEHLNDGIIKEIGDRLKTSKQLAFILKGNPRVYGIVDLSDVLDDYNISFYTIFSPIELNKFKFPKLRNHKHKKMTVSGQKLCSFEGIFWFHPDPFFKFPPV